MQLTNSQINSFKQVINVFKSKAKTRVTYKNIGGTVYLGIATHAPSNHYAITITQSGKVECI